MRQRFHPFSWLLVAAGLLASLIVLGFRYRAEARSRAVGILLDYGQFRALVAATGTPLEVAYRRMKSAGVTGIALTEETLGDLLADGVAEARTVPTPTGREARLAFTDPEAAARAAEALARWSPLAPTPPAGDRLALLAPGAPTRYIPGRLEEFRAAPIGLDPRLVREVRAAGLEPIGRLMNSLAVRPESIAESLRRTRELGVTTIIFSGDEVLGFRGLIPKTAAAFRELGLLYGSIEMGKQRGDDALTRLLAERHLRVHSISAAEMARLSPNEAVERYVRAAAERNIRLEYVRLPDFATGATFEDSVRYVDRLADSLAQEGFGIGTPAPLGRVLPEGAAARLGRGVIGAGVGAAAALLVAGLVPISRRAQAGLALVAAAGCALAAGGGALTPVALLAAIVFPTLGFVLFPQPIGAFALHEHATLRKRSPEATRAVVPAVAEFAAISAVTLVGALMVAGLLSELEFMTKIRSFAGVKLATVMPLLLVGAIYLTGMTGEYPDWRAERAGVLARLRSFFAGPVRVWHTVALLAGLVALALLLARSGNDPGIGVSDLELRLRALLDHLLGARPRTKEFLVGHPALLLALTMAAASPATRGGLPTGRWRQWAVPILLLGVVGQVGMLNSFCHLHTPLKLTLLRTFHGLWIGGLLGLMLGWAWSFVWARGTAAQET